MAALSTARDRGFGGRADVDWGLFAVLIAASLGVGMLLPGAPIKSSLILAAAIISFLTLKEMASTSVAWIHPLQLFIIVWLALVSLLSPDPIGSLNSAFLFITMLVYAFVREANGPRDLNTIALATTAALVPSFLGLFTNVLGPVVIAAGSTGGYAGYFPWNSAAGVCAGASILTIVTSVIRLGFSWWHAPAILLSMLMFVRADSATAFLAVSVAFAALALNFFVTRMSAVGGVMAALGLGAFVTWLAAQPLGGFKSIIGRISVAAGRNETASSRTFIWEQASAGISKSPLWGYGSTFWDESIKNSAHNGFLDLALSGGLLVAVAYGLLVMATFAKLARENSMLLPFFVFGFAVNLAISQVAVPTIAGLALALPIGATMRPSVTRDAFPATVGRDKQL